MSVGDALKPTAEHRLHGNSIEPVYRAVKTLAARQVFRGESGKMQDLLNYVMVALTQKDRVGLCDQLYDEGKAIRALLGHASLAMTSRYAKPDLAEVWRALDEIG